LSIASCGLTVDEEIKVFTLLIKVKPYYESFAANIRQQMCDMREDSSFIKLDMFIDNLLDEHGAQESSATAEANFADKNRQRPSNSDSVRKPKKPRCSRCKTDNHDNNGCWH
jgi:2-hydroxy-3-keto-5-methylthiopentenyl-1-phosphate phosphatase